MATAKKTTTTKKAAPKKAAPQKTAAKRAPSKTPVKTKVSQVRHAPTPAHTVKSFRRAKPAQPFMTFKPGVQTIYWVILATLVVGLSLWVAVITVRVQQLYDQIDANNQDTSGVVVPPSNY
jgi:hypothetical protein